jgi:hypothetical protein
MFRPKIRAMATGPSLPHPRGSKAVPNDANTCPNVIIICRYIYISRTRRRKEKDRA